MIEKYLENNGFQRFVEQLPQYQNAGVSQHTWSMLNELYQEGSLLSYENTIEILDTPEIYTEGNNQEIVSDQEISSFVNESFKADILRNACISYIDIRFDDVNIQIPKDNPFGIKSGEYYVPKDLFAKVYNDFSPQEQSYFSKNIFRGETFASWHRNDFNEVTQALKTGDVVFPTPVSIFNQDFDWRNKAIAEDSLSDAHLEYLQNVSPEMRRKQYVLGTIAHEIGHNIYQHLLYQKPHEQEFKDLIDEVGNITEYAEYYEHKHGVRDYDENFCECVRLFTTVPNTLNKDLIDFFNKYYPDIKQYE